MKYEQRVIDSRRVLAIRFSQDEKEVCLELDAGAADALARELALQSTLVGDDATVVVRVGRDYVSMDKQYAVQISRGLVRGKLRLEELEQAERIALDSAIMLRAGSNFALSNDPRIIDMAKVEAEHNRDLRRAMKGIKSTEAFGTPALIRRPPKAVH